MSASPWVDGQRALVNDTLRAALDGARACGLADFPRHLNVGDQAIWLGERAGLRALGIRVRAVCDRTTYSAARYRRALGDAPVLLHGGGNFGDLYPTHQALRERIVSDLPGHPVVQLAQSIHFDDPANLERARRVIAGHGEVTLVVRDEVSERFARTHFEARVLRSPDMAFAMGSLRRPASASVPLVVQAREDKERGREPVAGVETLDWLGELPDSDRAALLPHRLRLALTTGRRADGGRSVAIAPGRQRSAYDGFARWNVARGLWMLARGETVVTDRLHGHILCCLMGIPHVLVGDRHGKIRNYWTTWSHGAGLARWADDFEHALELARDPRPLRG